MKKYIILFLITLLLITYGCEEYNRRNPYFTFGQVGNEWVFERTTINGFPDTTIIDTVTYTLIESDNINSYYFEPSGVDWALEFPLYITPKEFGILPESIMLKSDSQVGDSYHTDILVVSVDDNLNVLGDAISCFHVKTGVTISPNTVSYWIHPDIGIVKMRQNVVGPDVGFSATYEIIDKNF